MAENPGELKRLVVGRGAWLSPYFWRWAAWFWLHSLMPGWADYNHQSHRLLAQFSLECRQRQLEKYPHQLGPALNQTATDTIKLFHDNKELETFLQSDQARFWAEAGHPFENLPLEKLLELEPNLAPDDALVGGVMSSVDSSGDIHLYTKAMAKLAIERVKLRIRPCGVLRVLREKIRHLCAIGIKLRWGPRS